MKTTAQLEITGPPAILSQITPEDISTPSQFKVCARIFWTWLVVRTLVWSILTYLTQPNAPLDTIEYLYWGREWCLGYAKHPPLAAWLADLLFRIGGGSIFTVYLGSYLSTACCIWSAWRLAREMVPPWLALFAALSLEGMVYYTASPGEFNNNIVLNACWALMVVASYMALQRGKMVFWLAAGLALGLGLLAKYSMAILAAPVVLFALMMPQTRRHWFGWGPYVAALVGLLIFLPHLYWAWQLDFPTISYALDRTEANPGLLNRLWMSLVFGESQIVRLLPVMVIFVPLIRWKQPDHRIETDSKDRFNRAFLLSVVLGPFLLHVLFPILTGRNVRDIYGSALWIFAGVLLATCLPIQRSNSAKAHAWRTLAVVALIMLCGVVGRNLLGPALQDRPHRIHFPGRQIAADVERRWESRFNRPIPLVAGDWWIAGNISIYSIDRPSVLAGSLDGPPSFTPAAGNWLRDEDLRQNGGVIVWNVHYHGAHIPSRLHQRFPGIEEQPPVEVPYQHWHTTKQCAIGIAFVPPAAEVMQQPR